MTDLFTRKSIRNALKRWQRTEQLGRHPLTQLTLIQQQTGNQAKATATTLGSALRQLLRRALEKLKPVSGEPDYGTQRWRPYLILTDQFIHYDTPDEVADKLGIARSTFNHAQAEALDRLASILREWEQEAKEADRPAQTTTSVQKVLFLAPPRPPHTLIGRQKLLRQIKQTLFNHRRPPSVTLLGLPGVGKTALAVELAHDDEVLRRFSDGILWARLGQAADPAVVLTTWANALGVSDKAIAQTTNLLSLAELIHAAIGMKRLLLVIDDAWEVETALAFRIGGPHCAHMLTTRLPDIAVQFAGEGVVAVPELDQHNSVQLLTQLAPTVVRRFPETVERFARVVGGLPLALVLFGSHLQIESYKTGPDQWQEFLDKVTADAALRARLDQAQSPLTRHPSLPAEATISLAAVIELSQQPLSAELRCLLQALTIFPSKPNSFSLDAATAATSQQPDTISQLVRHGLLETQGDGRYTIHQVIADHVRPSAYDQAFVERLVAYYVNYLQAHERDFARLESEMNNILVTIQAAEANGMATAYAILTNTFYTFLQVRGLYEVVRPLLSKALTLARATGDTTQTIHTLANLGHLAISQGDYETAEFTLRQGLTLAEGAGNPKDIGRLQQMLGVTYDHRGDYQEAIRLYEKSLHYARSAADEERVSAILMDLGALNHELGHYQQAESYLLEGLQIARQAGYVSTLSPLLLNLGAVAGSQGNLAQEEAYYQEALVVARSMSHQEDITFLLTNLGTLASDQGQFEQAEKYLSEGLTIAREIGHQERISSLLRHLATLAFRQSHIAQAKMYAIEGLEIARQLGHKRNICALLPVQGAIYQAEKAYEMALGCFQEALSIANELGHQWFTTEALIHFGELHLEQGEWAAAEEAFTEALAIAKQLESKGLEGEAIYGLARVQAKIGSQARAIGLGQQTLAIYRTLNDYRTDQVATWLEEISCHSDL